MGSVSLCYTVLFLLPGVWYINCTLLTLLHHGAVIVLLYRPLAQLGQVALEFVVLPQDPITFRLINLFVDNKSKLRVRAQLLTDFFQVMIQVSVSKKLSGVNSVQKIEHCSIGLIPNTLLHLLQISWKGICVKDHQFGLGNKPLTLP